MGSREETTRIPGSAVRFRSLHAGEGEALVFFHSFEGVDGWPEFLERLSCRYAVVVPLHPGVGGSEGVESLDDVVDLALAYDDWLTALGIARAHLLGHFFGGMVAAEIAALCPRRVGKVALISPMGLWLDAAPQADVVTLPPSELHPLLWRDLDSPEAQSWMTPPTSEEAKVAAQIERIQRLAVMGKFIWPIPDKGLKKRIHRITAPTLLLWGDADQINPVAYGEEFVRRLKSAELRVLRGGHMLPYEAPDAVARAVSDFLG